MKTRRTIPTTADELPVGRIAGVFGIRGELKCDPTSAGRMLFSNGETFRAVLRDGTSRSVVIAAVREHKGRFLVHFEGVQSADDAQTYAGATLHASRERITLAPGEFLDRDLEGCALYDEGGKKLGTVERVEHYPSSDMLVVGGRLVPMVGAFIKCIDTAEKRIVVDLPLGLLDEAQAERA